MRTDERNSTVSRTGLLIAAVLLTIGALIFFLGPSNFQELPRPLGDFLGFLLIPTVAGAFLIAGASMSGRRRRGLFYGAVAYLSVGLVSWLTVTVLDSNSVVDFFNQGFGILLRLLLWPLGLALEFFGS